MGFGPSRALLVGNCELEAEIYYSADVVADDGLGANNDVDKREGWFPYQSKHGEDVSENSGTSAVGNDVPVAC